MWLIIRPVTSSVTVSAVAQPSINLGYLGYILGVLIIFSGLVIIFGKGKGLFRRILGIYFGCFLIGMTFILASIYVTGLSYWIGIGFVVACCAIVTYLYLKKRVEFFNVFGIILAVTAPLILAFDFSFWTVVILLVILAIYDYIAVFWTKHMISLAKLTIAEGAPLPTMLVFGSVPDMQESFEKTRCRTWEILWLITNAGIVAELSSLMAKSLLSLKRAIRKLRNSEEDICIGSWRPCLAFFVSNSIIT